MITAAPDGDDDDTDPDGTAPLELTQTQREAARANVEWAAPGSTAEEAGAQIRAFDTETNTIFVGNPGNTLVLYYDSNDRFNIESGETANRVDQYSSYAAFERTLSKADGYTLEWGTIAGRSSATNSFKLNVPAPS